MIEETAAKEDGRDSAASAEPDAKYPIGRFFMPVPDSPDARREWIERIESFPRRLHDVVADLPDDAWARTYRPGGWNVRQVVHHVADSHMNSFIRFKLALTEERPVIKPYDEAAWAGLPDAQAHPSLSIVLLDALHGRWSALLKGMNDPQYSREFVNPESGRSVDLHTATALYAWHGDHHLAHVRLAVAPLGPAAAPGNSSV